MAAPLGRKPPRLRLTAELRDGLPACPGADAFVQLGVEVEPMTPTEGGAEHLSGSHDGGGGMPNNHAFHPSVSRLRGQPGDPGPGAAPAARLKEISVEWYGVERLDPAWVKPSVDRTRGRGGQQDAHQLPAGERYVARSPAGIITRDAVVRCGERHVFQVGVRLPPGIPPTFRGSVARYTYTMSFIVVVEAAGAGEGAETETVVHRLALPVQGAPPSGSVDGVVARGGHHAGRGGDAGPPPAGLGLADHAGDAASSDVGGSGRGGGLAEPWRLLSPRGPAGVFNDPTSPLAGASAGLGGRTASAFTHPASPFATLGSNPGGGGVKGPLAFNIRLGDGDRLLRVVPRAPLPTCVVGGPVSGVLDFSGEAATGALRCQQVSITLETEEVVRTNGDGGGRTGAGHVVDDNGNGAAGGPGRSVEAEEAAGDAVVLRKVWVENTEYVGGLARSHFLLTVPAGAPPSFSTSLVQLRWVLRFEFIAAPAGSKAPAGAAQKVDWRFPLEMASPQVNPPRDRRWPRGGGGVERAERVGAAAEGGRAMGVGGDALPLPLGMPTVAGGGVGDDTASDSSLGSADTRAGRGMLRDSSLLALS